MTTHVRSSIFVTAKVREEQDERVYNEGDEISVRVE